MKLTAGCPKIKNGRESCDKFILTKNCPPYLSFRPSLDRGVVKREVQSTIHEMG